VWLAAVSDRGDLSLRSTTGGRWGTTPISGRWSPYSSPSLAADTSGRMWLAAEEVGGEVVVRATEPHTTQWQSEIRLGQASETASTAVVPLPVAGVRVGALTSGGQQRWWTFGLPSTSMAGVTGARGGGFSASLQLRMP
jgi:hypothetical protein